MEITRAAFEYQVEPLLTRCIQIVAGVLRQAALEPVSGTLKAHVVLAVCSSHGRYLILAHMPLWPAICPEHANHNVDVHSSSAG